MKAQRGKKEHIETKEPNKSALKHNRRRINMYFDSKHAILVIIHESICPILC